MGDRVGLDADLCRAPVPGGCDGARETFIRWRNGRPSRSRRSLCSAHRKRKARGGRIDTPIKYRWKKDTRWVRKPVFLKRPG